MVHSDSRKVLWGSCLITSFSREDSGNRQVLDFIEGRSVPLSKSWIVDTLCGLREFDSRVVGEAH